MAAKSDKVIITCAVTGAIHTPTMSDALPITPDEIAAQAIDAAEAGAAILHLHARDPQDGRPTGDPAVFMQFLPRIKQATDAVINITTGGVADHDGRGAPRRRRCKLSPEMCSLNMGSMNFGALSRWPPLQEMEVRLGGAVSPRHQRRPSSATPSATSSASRSCSARGTAPSSSTSATTSATSTISRTASTARLVQAADLRAADLRHPRRHRRRHATTSCS